MEYVKPIQGIFYSQGYGQGKTVAMLSFKRPDETPQRLILDFEHRARTYKSSDAQDHPDKLYFAFDYFGSKYAEFMPDGDFTLEALAAMYTEVREGKFEYTMFGLDNAAMLQDQIIAILKAGNSRTVTPVGAKFKGVAQKHAAFLNKYKASSNIDLYGLANSITLELLRAFQVKGIDVITTTEAKNVWHAYGTRDMRIKGQTAKVLRSFMRSADFVYRLSRTTGSREDGTAKLIAIPWAIMDTFNPKNSLPGLQPRFEFTWETFWEQVASRGIATKEALAEVEVERSHAPQGFDTDDAITVGKEQWLSAAKKAGIVTSDKDSAGIKHLKEILESVGLTPDDAGDPEKLVAGLAAIDAENTAGD